MLPSRDRRRRRIAAFLVGVVALVAVAWKFGERHGTLESSAKRPTTAPMVGEYFLGGDVPRGGAYTVTGRAVTLRQALVAAQFGPQQAKDAAFIAIVRRTGKDGEEFIKIDPAALFERGEGNEAMQADDQVTVVAKSKPGGVP